MEHTFLAKSDPIESLERHTNALLNLYDNLREQYQESLNLSALDWQVLRDAAAFHDLGKTVPYFQKLIGSKIWEGLDEKSCLLTQDLEDLNQKFKLRHNLISPCFIDSNLIYDKYYELAKQSHPNLSEEEAEKLAEEAYELLIKTVLYHHNYPPSSITQKKTVLGKAIRVMSKLYTLNQDRITEIEWLYHYLNTKHQKDEEIRLNEGYLNLSSFKMSDYRFINKYFLMKGLLNKLDYSASAGYEIEEVIESDVGTKTEDFLKKTGYQKRKVQEYLLKHQDDSVIVQSSTGSGKTEAALLWLAKNKGYYTLPLKVSINAMYERIKNKIGYDEVKLLHGDAFPIYTDESRTDNNFSEEDLIQAHQAYNHAKLFHSKLLVCTIDQLFKFVYRYNGGELAFASMVMGKTVIDEIQMYEPKLIATLIWGLKMLVDTGGKFAIITATFPKSLYSLFEKYNIPFVKAEASSNKEYAKFYGPFACRHKIALLKNDDEYAREFDLEKILYSAKSKKVLIIANTIKRVQELYKKLSEMNDNSNNNIAIKTLHSHYIGRDRKILEQEISNFAPNNKNRDNSSGIWITTSIVEASLDIDFDILFTELKSIDTLIQRLGRIYRSRILVDFYSSYNSDSIVPNVYILCNGGSIPNMKEKEELLQYNIYKKSCEALEHHLSTHQDALIVECEERDDIQALMDYVYDEENQDTNNLGYYTLVNEYIKRFSNFEVYDYEKNEAEKEFRNINSKKIIPVPVYNENKDLIDEIVKELLSKISDNKIVKYARKEELRAKLDEYCINISNRSIVLKAELGGELFPYSNIYKPDEDYIFNSETKVGPGLIPKEEKGKEIDRRII